MAKSCWSKALEADDREMTSTMPDGYRIRMRVAADDPALVEVENRASELFRDHGFPDVADASIPDVAVLRAMMAGQKVWVAVDATDRPVGFAVAAAIEGYLHLRELSVDPAHGRRGVGTALVETVVAEARAGNFAGTSLTTFRNLPFNAPFYARLGFAVMPLDVAPAALKAQFLSEMPPGIDPESRVLMLRHRQVGEIDR
jgi:GNAT superfamily N-acetyltransferase